MSRAPVTYEQQMRDSDMIFTQITTASFADIHEANRTVVMLYVMDPTISRAGISHALKRLEAHYAAPGSKP